MTALLHCASMSISAAGDGGLPLRPPPPRTATGLPWCHGGQPLKTWPRRPPANEASIRPARSHHDEIDLHQAHRLAPLDDLDSDPGGVHRLVDPRGLLSFAGRYYLAARYLAGQVVQVRCAGGIVQIIHGGELVRAWQPRHTPSRSSACSDIPTSSSASPTPGH
jgi:hypothetical protein